MNPVRQLELLPTLAGLAHAALRSDILAGEIEPGAKLKMDELQSRYGFSSSPLREALSRLVGEQIVTVDERRGFRAAPVSRADLQDITEFRLVIEVNALDEAMVRGDATWEAAAVAALHQLTARERAVPAKVRARDSTWIAAHKAFHMALISACGSGRLLGACSAMFDQSQRYRLLSAQHRSAPRSSSAEHRRLLDTALRRDRETGRRLLREHIQTTADHVTTYLATLDDATSPVLAAAAADLGA